MANGKTQTERSTLSLMSHKRSRDGLNPGHLAFCPGLSYATLFFVLFCFLMVVIVIKTDSLWYHQKT